MNISNAEKQSRFRRKEELKKLAEQTFREWQVMAIHSRAQPREVLTLLNNAAGLSAGWSDVDYERAERRIQQLRMDLITSQDDVKNDVHEARSSNEQFLKSPDPDKWIAETNAAVTDAHSLASHLISALELSRCSDAGRAAAVMEALRHVGRALANSPTVPKSNATTACLSSLPSHYDRPKWLARSMAHWLAWQLDEEVTRELGNRLSNFDYEAFP